MRSGMPRGLFLLALTLITAPLALGGCMSKAKKHLYAAEDLFEKRDLKGAQAELQEAIKESVESPAFADAGKTIGFTPAYLPSEDFGALIASDDAKLAQVMGDLGLKKK